MRIPLSFILSSLFLYSFTYSALAGGGVNLQELEKQKSARVTYVVRATEKVLNSVVSIGSEVSEFSIDMNGTGELKKSLRYNGSGVIIDSKGLILSAWHVVEKLEQIIITTSEGKHYKAHILFHDEDSDLAMLTINDAPEESYFRAISFALPNDLIPGEPVIAIGAPFGLQHSVSTGILSSSHRRIEKDQEVEFADLLQANLAINPGNSGGPLINADGELIGINLSQHKKAQGISFALPVSRIETLLSDWLSPRYSTGAYAGFKVKTLFDPKSRKSHVIISEIDETHPDALKLNKGEIITSLNGLELKSSIDFYRRLRVMEPGEPLNLLNAVGEEKELSLLPVNAALIARFKSGLELQRLNAALAGASKLPFTEGYIIKKVLPNIEKLGDNQIERGDVLMTINNIDIFDEVSLRQAISSLKRKQKVEAVFLRVDPDGNFSYFIQIIDIIN